MFKKTVLVASVFALACVAYVTYQWQDPPPVAGKSEDRAARPPMRSLLASQPASQPGTFEYRGAEIRPGDGMKIRVFNPDGSVRMLFQCTKSHPLSATEFEVTQPTARVLLPGGQLAYVRGDEGLIVLQRNDKNNLDVKRGRLTGHVQVFVDRSSPDERREDPETAEPEDRPEAVVKVWMDDVSFDMDLARLETNGPVKVQSVDATVEGRGLTLIWNEVTRRIKLLRIDEGRRALVHMRSLVQLGVAGGEAKAETASQPAAAESAPPTKPMPELASGNKKGNTSIRLSDLEETDVAPTAERIDTYQIVFKDNIVAEQRQGIRVLGRLEADVLELLRDFGSRERSAVERAPSSQPAQADAKPRPSRDKTPKAEDAGGEDGVVKKDSTLELRWSGELMVTPVAESDRPAPTAAGDRFHVNARGNPLRLHDRETGDVVCRSLEYKDETQEVWLQGDARQPVMLQADARRTLTGERVFLDRKRGIARVEGPGTMTDVKADDDAKAWPECIKNELAKYAKTKPAGQDKARQAEDDRILVTWKDGVEVRFAVPQGAQAPSPQPGGFGAGKEYLQSAQFRGEVSFDQPGQSMSADQIDIVFAPPAVESADRKQGISAESILAVGNVRMTNDRSLISCDRLEADMGTDDVGRNVPKVGRAFGHVIARQGGQEIRATDQMVVNLESIPRETDPVERERYEAAARVCGYTAESEEWKAVEAKLAARREMLVRTLVARGEVSVRDPDENLDVGADVLECAFDDRQQITQAFVIGGSQAPAHVGMSDFYIRGPRINFRVTDQTADVPGEGILRFFTKQDISGRRTDEPVPVVVTWKNNMSFRGGMNLGSFSGQVRAVSEGTILDCRELNLRFENEPLDRSTSASKPAGPDPRWIAGRVIDLLAEGREGAPQASAAGLSKGFRKRLTHIHAIGDAVIASSEFERPKPQFGPFSDIMASIMPDAIRASQPATPDEQRLLSFARVSGPRITIDLNDEHLAVEGAGNLLVLDYRPPAAGLAAKTEANKLNTSMIGSLRGGGPSQTVFTWQNSMTYISRRNAAVLTKQVVMAHVSGAEMVMPEQVAAAMKMDVRSLTGIKSRRASLTCESLVVQFAPSRNRTGTTQASLSSATELKMFQASERVRMQENNRSVEGESVTYESDPGRILIQGSPLLPARIAEMDERTGDVPTSWRGEELEWNLQTGVVKVKGASITAPGR